MRTANMHVQGRAGILNRGNVLTTVLPCGRCLPYQRSAPRAPDRSNRHCRAVPLDAAAAAVPASQQLAELMSSALLAQLPFSFPAFDVLTVLGFLLNNPVVTVALAVGLYVFLPRIWRWVLKRLLLPAAILLLLVFAAQHPTQTVLLGRSVLAFVGSNPVVVSAVAIGALAILLSPYILVAGVVAGLIFGLPQLPPPFSALVPAPVREAEHKFEDFSRFLRRQAPALLTPDVAVDLISNGEVDQDLRHF